LPGSFEACVDHLFLFTLDTTMNAIEKITGSRYRKHLPFAYEAVIDVLEDGDASLRISYLSDTVCGLTHFLEQQGESPDSVELFELFRGNQTSVPKDCYLDAGGEWLPRAALCKPMTKRYNEAGQPGRCPFCDRKEPVIGPC
jgi:hypothetical protein